MSPRPRFFDDLAGVAGGAMSALVGVRDEIETAVKARVEEVVRRLDLATRADLDATAEVATNARAGQEDADARIATLEARVAALEAEVASLRPPPPQPPGDVLIG